MKQKTRFKTFGNIGIGYQYQSMNDRYIGIGPNKAILVDLYSLYWKCNFHVVFQMYRRRLYTKAIWREI